MANAPSWNELSTTPGPSWDELDAKAPSFLDVVNQANPMNWVSTPRQKLEAAKAVASGLGEAVKSAGIRGGPAMVGQMAGAPFGPYAAAAGGAIGGAVGSAADQLRQGYFKPGEFVADTAVSAIPMGPLAGVPAKIVAKRMAGQAGSNLAAGEVQSVIDEGRPLNVKETVLNVAGSMLGLGAAKKLDRGVKAAEVAAKKSMDSVRRETLRLGRELGYVVPPSTVNPNLGNDFMNSLGGKAATAQEAILKNQPVTNAAVRAEIGLPPNATISPISLNTMRAGPNSVYKKIQDSTPELRSVLEQVKQADANTKLAYQAWNESKMTGQTNPETLAKAKAWEAESDRLRADMRAEAKKIGKSDLVDEFEEAREKLAKIGLAERALNKGDGNIDASIIGAAFEDGERLTGNFSKIGRFQNAFGKLLRNASDTPAPGVNQLSSYLAAGLGLGGAAKFGPGGAMLAALPFAAQGPARGAMLSPAYQRAFANPQYGAEMADAMAQYARLGGQAAGRNPYFVNRPAQ